MTKKQIIAKIQELANEYLGHGGLCFDNYIYLKKDDLIARLEKAESMIIIKREAEALRSEHTKNEWLAAAIGATSEHTKNEWLEEMRPKREKLNNLLRAANDIWLKI